MAASKPKNNAKHSTRAPPAPASAAERRRKASPPKPSPEKTAELLPLTSPPVVTPAQVGGGLSFDPATGDWIQAKPAEPDPAAPRRDALAIIMWVLMAVDLLILAWLLISNVRVGAVLAFSPDSQAAEQFREQLGSSSARDIAINSLISFGLFGLIPIAWVVGTRRKPWEGTKKFLHLTGSSRYIWKGALLTLPIILLVMGFVYIYVFATEGTAGFDSDNGQSNPAVDALLANMTIPLALLVSLAAGIGEEIMFRGVLQKWLGVWGQAVVFGLAHAAGGYLPQIVFAFALAVFFGFLLKRGWPLWALMLTHFLYDFVLLAGAALGAKF